MPKQSVTIVLPTFEEAESLPSLIAAIEVVRDDSMLDLSLLIVDDNSNDGTESLFTSFYSSTLNIFSSSSKFITPGNN